MMKSLAGGSTSGGHMNYLPKLRLKRTRTCSSDSGCDVFCDSPDMSSSMMEDAVHSWETRLDDVVRQEVERAREVTNWAKEALRHASEDEDRRQEVLESWRSQLGGIMEFTKDLVECVNNDTKEVMYDSMGFSLGHESNMEEIEEDDEEKEEEIMQLFLLSAMGGNQNLQKRGKSGSKGLVKEFMSIYKKNGKVFKSSRKASKEVQAAYSKIKRQESFAKRRLSFEEVKFANEYEPQDDFAYSQKMFDSVLESAELFNDWHWNFDENESCENIFAEWRWNLEVQADLKVQYYDDPDIETEWNDFNFWNIKDISDSLKHEIDTGFLGDCEEDEMWSDCKFWQNSDENENILHSLMDDVVEENLNTSLKHFWDESMINQSILESLIEEDEKVSTDKKDFEDEFIWEANHIVLALINSKHAEKAKENDYDPKTISTEVMTEEDKDTKTEDDQKLFLWEDQNHIDLLFGYDEHSDLITFSDENEDFFPREDFSATNSKERKSKTLLKLETEGESNSWVFWPFWNKFGLASEIMKAYEETNNVDFNEQKRFWDLNFEDSMPLTQNETVNTEEAKEISKNVFPVPNNHKREDISQTNVFEEIEDIYADWALVALCDDRTEKKRQLRGRKKERISGGSNKENYSKSGLGHRRPDTPNIQNSTKSSSNKCYDFDQCWIETKVPKKERKTVHVWKNARSQKRLSAKIYAKQPRSFM